MSKFDVTDTYAPCPRCWCQYAKRHNMLMLVGALGDVLFHPVKCINCGKIYNGKTGDANFAAMLAFAGTVAMLGFFLWWIMSGTRF